jgi:DNA-binding response OmpR family regulator
MQRKILVVDDYPEMVELLRFNLKGAGFWVGTAANGRLALNKVCSLAPDLIVLDLMMPELDGFAFCEILRHDPVTCAIPVILLTAVCSQFARLTGLEAGADDYLTKPFRPAELVARVRSLLQRRAKQ